MNGDPADGDDRAEGDATGTPSPAVDEGLEPTAPPDALPPDVAPPDSAPPRERSALDHAIEALPAPFPLPSPDLLHRDDGPSPSGLTILRDNLEAIAFALILALMLRHAVVEVFKIPTSSMEPTLYGDNSSTHPGTPGDRILVAKDAYLFRDPERWDVIVFHYPLDWSRDFIKRLVAGPNEVVRIERGDVWVGDAIGEPDSILRPARKPKRVRDQLYFAVYPPAGAAATGRPEVWWRETSRATGDIVAVAHGKIRYRGDRPGVSRDDEAATLRYGIEIRDDSRPTSDPERSSGASRIVCDIRLRCRVTADGSSEVELAWAPGDGRRHAVRLADTDRGGSSARTKTAERPLSTPLTAGRAMAVELESIDGDLRVTIDGEEVAVVPDEISVEEAVRLEDLGFGGPTRDLTVSARGAPVSIDDVRIDRDLYYTNWRETDNWPQRDHPLRLGADEYFVLGDNTRSSSDARRWSATGVRLKDGRRILWEWQARVERTVEGGRTRREVVDIEGVKRRWFEDEEDGIESVRMPFVKRDRIVGKAWFALVFWPLDKILPRVRFVH